MILGSGETPSVSADRYENLGFLQWMHWSDGRGVGWGHCDPKLVRPHYLREDLVLAQSDVYCRVDEVFQQGFDRFAVEERGFSAESMVQYYSCQMNHGFGRKSSLLDRKRTRLNSSHPSTLYAVFGS